MVGGVTELGADGRSYTGEQGPVGASGHGVAHRAPADDHAVDIEGHHEVGHADRHVSSESLGEFLGFGRSGVEEEPKIAAVDRWSSIKSELFGHHHVAECLARRIQLPASPSTTDTRGPIEGDHMMADLAGETVGTVQQSTVVDDPAADARAETDVEHRSRSGSLAELMEVLGPRRTRVVILDDHVQPKPIAKRAYEIDFYDPGEVGRIPEDSVVGHQTRNAETGTNERLRAPPDEFGGHGGQQVDKRHCPFRCGDSNHLPDVAGVVEQHAHALRSPEIEPNGPRRRRLPGADLV